MLLVTGPGFESETFRIRSKNATFGPKKLCSILTITKLSPQSGAIISRKNSYKVLPVNGHCSIIDGQHPLLKYPVFQFPAAHFRFPHSSADSYNAFSITVAETRPDKDVLSKTQRKTRNGMVCALLENVGNSFIVILRFLMKGGLEN